MAKKTYDDDDGRSFADMSQLERPSLFGHLSERRERKKSPSGASHNPYAEDEMTREERRWYIFGAMKASLLIGLAYVVGLGLLILLMVSLW